MKNNYALIIVDMLNDFVIGKLGSEPAKKVVLPNKELISFAHKNNIPVIYTCDSHLKDIDFEFTKWDNHALKGDKGSEILDELKPKESDYIIYKRRYSAFFHTDLDLLLKELKVDTLIVTGVQTHICVIHTLASAFMNGFNTVLVSDATSSPDINDYNNSINYAKEMYNTKILTSSEVIKSIK